MEWVTKTLDYRFRDRISQVREAFKEKVKELVEEEQIYQQDYDKTMTNDYWVEKHLEWRGGNIGKTVDGLIYAGKTIKKYRLRELKRSDFAYETYSHGAVFDYLPDVLGRKTYYLRLKYADSSKELRAVNRQFGLFMGLRQEEESGEQGCVMIMDMAGASLTNNVDTKLAILNRDMSDIFPPFNVLAIAVNVPFLLRSMIKTALFLLPVDMRKGFLVLTTEELTQIIPAENLPDFLGGTSKRPYSGDEVVPKGTLTFKEMFDRLMVDDVDENGNFINNRDHIGDQGMNSLVLWPKITKQNKEKLLNNLDHLYSSK